MEIGVIGQFSMEVIVSKMATNGSLNSIETVPILNPYMVDLVLAMLQNWKSVCQVFSKASVA